MDNIADIATLLGAASTLITVLTASVVKIIYALRDRQDPNAH